VGSDLLVYYLPRRRALVGSAHREATPREPDAIAQSHVRAALALQSALA
jgi:hypothetical protein